MSIFFYLTKIYIPFYVLFLLAALVLSIISYRRIREELTKLWLTLYIILRTMVFFLIFSALFSLIIELRFSKREKPSVFVLLDSSGSMDIEKDGVSRKTEAIQLLKNKLIPSIETKADIRLLLFSDKIYVPADSLYLNKGTTIIGNVLKEASNIEEKPPSALFLISDGRSTAGEDPLEIAKRLSFPIFAVKIGKLMEENNVKISGLRVNPIVYRGDSVPVTVILSNSGVARKSVIIEIKKSGRVLDKEKISLLEAGIDYPVQLTFVPKKSGIENFEITISSYKDETNRDDNKRNFAVKVLKKRKMVVLLTYKLNWDYRFLRDFLMSQKEIEPVCYAQVNSKQFLIQHGKDEKRGNLNYETIINSDILILINPETIEQNLFSKITKRVYSEGMGLLLIGNRLPDFSEFRNVYPFVISGNPFSGDFEPIITQAGRNSPIFTTGRHLPSSLPPLSNPLRIKAVKPITEVYLEGEKRGSINVPLFGSINYGKGKIAAFTAENVWHWKMLPFATKESPRLYDELMNNILKWLAVRKEEERVMLYMEKTKLLWGEPINLSVTLYDEMMKPLEGGIIVLRLKKDNEAVEDFMMKDVGEGNYEKSITMLEPGMYTMQAEVKFPEGMRNKPTLNFEIESQEIENLNRDPNHLLLDNISDASGGKSISSENVLQEVKRLALKPLILFTRKKFYFGNNLFILLFISVLFLLELFLRKLKGLK